MGQISEADIKLLWGRAGGICSNPVCGKDLTVLNSQLQWFQIGEMAHIIARQEDGPRGQTGGGSNAYENLILLCPTCHTMIDKAPAGQYTQEILISWKNDHETKIRDAFARITFGSLDDLKREIGFILLDNHQLYEEFGPKSVAAQDPESNLWKMWSEVKEKSLVPNNKKIIKIIQGNLRLLGPEEAKLFFRFKAHADGFEKNQYSRLDSYPLFPAEFAEVFRI
ncbi:HNH endonuclease signature motif containing protein [Deinococcus xianganensis]|uniref:HNH endonuclease n=1 Tax=Deinococcus xianganensis TaxID=1507289 RepID=A0A6I4YPN7_9DEIO|nr:HNH endonuclease signature motif containing protein [Deinococcus xianganensis]MXV19093.1 HNH endonuclease [Deinococcus xianganensis]